MNVFSRRARQTIGLLLFKSGFRKSIPATIINCIPIEDCGEPMIDLKTAPFLLVDECLDDKKEVLVRKSVYEKLKLVSQWVPGSYHLKIHSAYRSRTEQLALWNKKCNEIRMKFPDLTEEEVALRTKKVCADPRFGFGGHQTGGAVDITLCDDNGVDYDMGTMISDDRESKILTCSTEISMEARKNRTILLSVMTKAGFVNYPKEWWHYCYGDRMWAAYKNKNKAVYGEVISA